MTRKLPAVIAVLFIVSLPLFAHGQSEATSTAQTASAQQPINLSMVWWGSKTRHVETIKVIQLYEKEHPNVHIDYQFTGWSDYWTKVTTEAAGKNLPDIMQQDYGYINDWVSRGLLSNLDPYVKSGVINLSDTRPLYLAGGKINGHLYGVDLGANTQAWVLDADAFKKAGIPIPPNDWTWKDFENIALQIHQKLGILAMGPNFTSWPLWEALYLGEGQWAYAANGKSLGYTDNTPFVNYLKMALKLQAAGAIPSESDVVAFTNKGVQQLPIVTGKAAMAFAWSNQLVALQHAAGPSRKFILHTLPRPVGGKPENYIKNSQFFSIAAQSKHPKAAAEFINFFVNSVEANKILLGERGVPIMAKVRQGIAPLLGPTGKEEMKYVGFVGNGFASPTPPPDPSKASNVINNIYQPLVIQPVMFRKISPEQGAALLMKQANAVLSGKAQ